MSTRPDSPMSALLDAMPDATAVLDREGTITAVNHAWRMFSLDNGGDPERTGTGINYFEVCERAAAAGCADAGDVAEGLQAVLKGRSVESDLEYPCPSPAVGRWFVLRATLIQGSEPGLLVGHVNISRRKMAERDLERQASEDPLTSLANRSQFTERLGKALLPRPGRRAEADVGLLYLDLDKFKPINDTFGHAAGDEVLQTVAARLRATVRPQDTTARLGGDEFAIVAPRITAGELAGLAERVKRAIEIPQVIHGREVAVGASVGTFLAAAGADLAESLRQADEAMFAVKRTRSLGAGGR